MKSIGVIGTGNIGTHLIKLMCKNNCNYHITIADRNIKKLESLVNIHGGIELNTNKETIELADILFLTVKPNEIKSLCDEINEYTQDGCRSKLTIVSAAAGVPVDKIKEWTNNSHDIVRCMPNIPVSIFEGSILWYSDSDNIKHDRWDGFSITKDVTRGPYNIWVKNEALIDAGTILSACSPAYLAKLYSIYVEMGQELGFDQHQSKKLLHNSFSGTIKLLLDNNPEYIIEQVSSKGGATEKSLEVLDEGDIKGIIGKSISDTYERIRDIRKQLD